MYFYTPVLAAAGALYYWDRFGRRKRNYRHKTRVASGRRVQAMRNCGTNSRCACRSHGSY